MIAHRLSLRGNLWIVARVIEANERQIRRFSVRRLLRGRIGIALAALLALALVTGALVSLAPAGLAPRGELVQPSVTVRPPAPVSPAADAEAQKRAVQPEGVVAPQTAPAALPAQRPAAPARPAAAAGGQADAAASAAQWDRMIIRNATLALQVENVDAALQKVRDIARASGGFVASSSTHVEKINDHERTVANLVIQVRADAFDSAMTALRQIAANVDGESVATQDVTEEYVDLQSNLRNLQASEAAILRLMDRAQRIEDILALQRELTNMRGQIERLEGRRRFLERRTEMATIAVTLRLPPVEGTRPLVRGTGWNPLAAAERGWEASLVILRQVAEAVIVALAFSWWLAPLIALGAYLWHSRRARTQPSAARPPEA
jgi:hypothetical protein